MITDNEITVIGSFGKTHGIDGEINLRITCDVDIKTLSCIVVDIDGINVPFFFESVRQRGMESYLVRIDGIDSEQQASSLVNKDVSALDMELGDAREDDGFYAEDMIGFKVESSEPMFAGEIIDIDDSTDNILFVVRTDSGRQVLIPVADEFIVSLDADKRFVRMNLPDGLIEL